MRPRLVEIDDVGHGGHRTGCYRLQPHTLIPASFYRNNYSIPQRTTFDARNRCSRTGRAQYSAPLRAFRSNFVRPSRPRLLSEWCGIFFGSAANFVGGGIGDQQKRAA